jgi:mRNA-degrading endonuclease RelE of RelBE toxin-antitoxin system
MAVRIREATHRYAETGDGDVRRLTGYRPELFRLRVGDWRVLFRVDEDGVIEVARVLHRREAYR